METPEQDTEAEIKHSAHDTKEIMMFENSISELMFAIGSKMTNRVKSFQLMRDDDFVHRRDRTTNDIHIFFELKNGQYFHLRAYTRHMLDMENRPEDQIFLTGYTKESISHTGGNHALRQGWYSWNAEEIAKELVAQQPELFE